MKKDIICTMLLFVFIISGCGFLPDIPEENTGNSKKIIENFNFDGTKRSFSINYIPQNIIVCGNNAADTLIAFEEGCKISTLILTNTYDKEKYVEVLPQAKIYTAGISQEAAVELKPDFILAQRRFFDDKALGSNMFWSNNGVMTYIQDASGPIPSLGNFPKCTVESEKNFINNMGKIFGKEDIANKFNKEINNAMTTENNIDKLHPKVLVVEFINGNIEVFGKKLLSGDIITQLGGDIVDYGYPFISLEKLMQSEADIVFVVYHGKDIEKNIALRKMNDPVFHDIKAVREGKVYPLNYNSIVATGVNTVNTINYIREKLTSQ